MNIKLLLLASVAITTGACNTAYKSTQTPDDVYYSPTRVIEEDKDKDDDEDEINETSDNRTIRMKTRDRRWRNMDNEYDYKYDPYHYGYNYGYYYNPYYYPSPVYGCNCCIKLTNPTNSSIRMTNLASYNNTTITTPGTKFGTSTTTRKGRAYNNSNSGGRYNRQPSTIPDNNSSGTSGSSRTYSPSSSGSSSSGSSSGTSLPRQPRN